MAAFIIVAISLFFLIKSADVFVDQASALAQKIKLSNFLIGFTIVAFGTSLPELVSTVFSAIAGHNNLLVSNIIGSNITNSCLIFGLVALLKKFKIGKRDIDVNIPFNMVAIVLFWILTVFMSFTLNWSAGILLILIFFILQILSKKYNRFENLKISDVKFNLLILISSLMLLVVFEKICIDQIINLAQQFKISETILGYFLLAIGTSLPELTVTWIAVNKKNKDIAVGNILGSNLFNLLFIFGISTFIEPLQLNAFKIDLMFLAGVTIIIYVLAIKGKKYFFGKKEGIGLLFLYFLFVLLQIFKI